MNIVQYLHNFTLLSHFADILARVIVSKLAATVQVSKKTGVKIKYDISKRKLVDKNLF
jgi:hypothetical protein